MSDQRRGRVGLVDIREEPIDVGEVLAGLGDDACGGQAVFIGRVRDHDHGRGVTTLEYAAHPSAQEKLAALCAEIATDDELISLAAVHRVGSLSVGDIAVVVAAESAHRDGAFRLTRTLIDRLKDEIPIWKHQKFLDGDEEWVGSP
ncbi:MAG: molybdenum cofactor biosynthesis protein MoaE [Nocardioides sp.]|nr:molybdenum cofactor biosynthesis protein MoaE [Nocardioides sp.]